MHHISSDTEYQAFIAEIKQRYRNAQLKAVSTVNEQMIEFYWDLGKRILAKQKAAKWGSKFLAQISMDIQRDFPGTKGFSVSNLERMRKFARLYPESISAQAVRKIPWGHIVVLIEQVKDPAARVWYVNNILRNGIARSVLSIQIEQEEYR